MLNSILRRKIFFNIFIIITLVFTFFYNKGAYSLNTPEEIHVYIPFEFQASIFMYADLIQRPDTTKKIVFQDGNIIKKEKWSDKIILGNLNLSNGLEIQNGFLYSNLDEFKKIYKKYPNAQYSFHTAVFMSLTRLIPFLQIIPKEKIKQIYLYESSIGRTLSNNTDLWSPGYSFNKKNLETCIKYHCLQTKELIFSTHLLYPTTYYLGLLEEIKQTPDMESFIKGTHGATLKDMNFIKLKNTLTEKEKNKLFNLYDFNVLDYKAIIKNKKVNLFVVGHGSEYKVDRTIQAIEKWYQEYSKKDELLFIKYGRNHNIEKELQKKSIIIPEFPMKVPFELLVLADLIPDSISGTPTSLFLNIPKKNVGTIYNVEKYIHEKLLIEKIGKDKIVSL